MVDWSWQRDRSYKFVKSGTTSDHCTYCPKLPNERCGLRCATVYGELVKEREADGFKGRR